MTILLREMITQITALHRNFAAVKCGKMEKSAYQEAATRHAKEHLDMLLRMETTLGRKNSQTNHQLKNKQT